MSYFKRTGKREKERERESREKIECMRVRERESFSPYISIATMFGVDMIILLYHPKALRF